MKKLFCMVVFSFVCFCAFPMEKRTGTDDVSSNITDPMPGGNSVGCEGKKKKKRNCRCLSCRIDRIRRFFTEDCPEFIKSFCSNGEGGFLDPEQGDASPISSIVDTEASRDEKKKEKRYCRCPACLIKAFCLCGEPGHTDDEGEDRDYSPGNWFELFQEAEAD